MPKKRKLSQAVDAEAILAQIERVVRWADTFRLAFIKCNHPRQQEAMRRALLERMSDKRILEIFLDKPIVSLLDEISSRWDAAQPPDAVCVYGLDKSLSDKRETAPVLGRLNHDRDLMRRAIPAALLIWLPDFALDYVARGAPDFWAWRSGVYEFPTDVDLWLTEVGFSFERDSADLFLLSLEERQQEIKRLEQLWRAAQNLTNQDKRVQETNARLLNRLGQLYASLYRWREAQSNLEQSLVIYRTIGDRAGEGSTLNNLAQIYDAQGDYARAMDCLQQALAIDHVIGERAGEGITLNNIGKIYQTQGDYARALNYLQQSLTIQRAIGDQREGGSTLNNIATIYHAQGDYARTLDYLQQALTISRAIGDRRGEGTTLNNISLIYYAQGDYVKALDYLQQSLTIRQAVGDRAGEGATLNNFSLIYQTRGDYVRALDYLQQALAISQAIGDQAGLCAGLFNMGFIHDHNEEPQQALASWVAAYRIAREIGYAEGLQNLDNLAKRLGGPGLEYWEMLLRQSPAGEDGG